MYSATVKGDTDIQITEGQEPGSRAVRVAYGEHCAIVVVPPYVASRWGVAGGIREAFTLVHRAMVDQMVRDMYADAEAKAKLKEEQA